MLNVLAHGTWLGRRGAGPHYLLQQPGHVEFSEAVLPAWDGSDPWGRIAAPSPLRPGLRSHIPPATRPPRSCWSCGGARLAVGAPCPRAGAPGLRARNATPEEEPQKCLNLSPFLALLTSDLRALGFLLWSPWPPLCPPMGVERAVVAELGPERPALSLHGLQRQFHGECQVKHLRGIFSIYFIKLYI